MLGNVWKVKVPGNFNWERKVGEMDQVLSQETEEVLRIRRELEGENEMTKELGKWNARYAQTAAQARMLDAECQHLEEEIQELEEGGFKSMAYRLLFKRKKTLRRMRAEKARLGEEFEEARKQQKRDEEKVRFYENELFRMEGLKRRLKRLESEKIADYKGKAAEDVDVDFIALEKEVAGQKEEITQLKKALRAGRAAYELAGEIVSNLESAEQIGRQDMYSSSFLVTYDKHQYLKAAQRRLDDLRTQVQGFKGELMEAGLPEEFGVEIGGFWKFADYFLDGLCVDYHTMRKIRKAAVPVMQFRRKMEGILEGMERRLAVMEKVCGKKDEVLQNKLFL